MPSNSITITLILHIVLFIVLTSCESDNEELQDSFTECPIIIGIRSDTLLDSSLMAIPYINTRSVTFKDSKDNDLIFVVQEFEIDDSPALYYINDECNNIDSILYRHQVESKSIFLKNDSLDIKFYVLLSVEVERKDVGKGHVADVLRIIISDPDIVNRGKRVLEHIVQQRSWTEDWEINFLDSINIQNKNFKNVYFNDFPEAEQTIYFNYQHGILNFTDRKNNSYIFKSIE